MDADLPHLQGLDSKKLRLLEWLTTLPAAREEAGLPKTKDGLARELGVAPRTLRDWQSKEGFIKAHEAEARRLSGGPEKTQQILEALLVQGLDNQSPKQVQAAKLWLEATGAIAPKAQQIEVDVKGGRRAAELSDEELDALIAARAGDELAQRRVARG